MEALCVMNIYIINLYCSSAANKEVSLSAFLLYF